MKNFFKTMFASTLGFLLGVILLSFIAFFIISGVIASSVSANTYTLKNNTLLKLDLNGTVTERSVSDPLSFIKNDNSGTTGLNDILKAIQKAKENDKIRGIYIRTGYLSTGIASLEPIRNALLDFKKSGKFVIAYGEFFSQGAYYIASTADKIILNPQGTFDFKGLASSIEFQKGFLDKIGIKMQVFKVGTYKSAVEPYILNKMSDANRAQMTSLLNDLWGHILSGISVSRHIPTDLLNRYADRYMAFSDPTYAVKSHLVDQLMYTPEVERLLKEKLKLKDSDKLNLASVDDMTSVPLIHSNDSKNKIAVLYAEGEIFDDNLASNPYTTENYITAKEYVKDLEKLKNDKNVKAVVFRVNSPGGSAYASEQIWHAVSELRKVKPIVVSMGDYAASGGYYISCDASKIIAEPTSITGSIGIFGMFPDGEALANKLGLTYDEVQTNKHSALGRAAIFGYFPAKGLDSESQLMLQKYIERGYDTFLSRCAEGRKKTKSQINAIGQGRVWTGSQAVKLGLVDKLGGIDLALQTAAELAKVKDYSISEYPAQKDLFSKILQESTTTVSTRFAKFFMGDELFQQKEIAERIKTFEIIRAIAPYKIDY